MPITVLFLQRTSPVNVDKLLLSLHLLKIERILRNIKYLFEHAEKEESCFKPVRVSNFWSKNHIEFESNSDRNKE